MGCIRPWLSSFRLVLEGKKGKEILESSRLESLEKFSENNFALSDVEDITSGPLNRGGIADLPLLRTLLAPHQKSQEPSFWEVMNYYVLFICKFGSFKNSFAIITSPALLSIQNIYSVGTNKKVIPMNYGHIISHWKPRRWVRLDLILTMRDIYINSNLNPLIKLTSSSRSTEFKDIPNRTTLKWPWRMSQSAQE